jgi:thioredoxin-related protein
MVNNPLKSHLSDSTFEFLIKNELLREKGVRDFKIRNAFQNLKQEVSEAYKGKVNIYKINTEEEQELAAAFGIRSIPSMLFCPQSGKPQMAVGALPKESLIKAIKDTLGVE